MKNVLGHLEKDPPLQWNRLAFRGSWSVSGFIFGGSTWSLEGQVLIVMVDSLPRNVYLIGMEGKEVSSDCQWQNPNIAVRCH